MAVDSEGWDDGTNGYPWDDAADGGYWDDDLWWRDDDPRAAALWSNPELLREELYSLGVREYPDLPELAAVWLSELAKVGLSTSDSAPAGFLKQAADQRPRFDPRGGELHPVRLEGHDQLFWLKLDGLPAVRGEKRGYNTIRVLDGPLKTDVAIVALLTVLEGTSVDTSRVCANLDHLRVPLDASQFRYVRSLLRYYRPSFDDLPHDEQAVLIEETCKRVDTFLRASRQLAEFLEYGVPARDLKPPVSDATRDVEAAVLSDVEGLNHIQIAKRFGLKVKGKHHEERDHSTARCMAKRGRSLLEGALGEAGWQRQIETMKADGEWFRSLSKRRRTFYVVLRISGSIPQKEARQLATETDEETLTAVLGEPE